MKNINSLSQHLLTTAAAIIVIVGCIYAGRTEFNDTVLSGMSDSKYKYIHDSLGSHTSEKDVVKEYIANQKYYDSKEC